jgi:hypothetical protein
MSNLIARLRLEAQAGTADFAVSGTDYYTDDQLQDILDRHFSIIADEKLTYEETYDSNGTAVYHDYYSQFSNFEEETSGTQYFYVRESSGTIHGTANYALDPLVGHIRFTSNQAGSTYYLWGRSYDLNASAADIWRHRMGNVASYYSFRSDDQAMDRSDWFKHCRNMVDYYEAKSGPRQVRMMRDDLA